MGESPAGRACAAYLRKNIQEMKSRLPAEKETTAGEGVGLTLIPCTLTGCFVDIDSKRERKGCVDRHRQRPGCGSDAQVLPVTHGIVRHAHRASGTHPQQLPKGQDTPHTRGCRTSCASETFNFFIMRVLLRSNYKNALGKKIHNFGVHTVAWWLSCCQQCWLPT